MKSRVLITAGAGGIGRAIAEAFDASGAKVWVVDLDRDALNKSPGTWGKSHGDVADENFVADAVDDMVGQWGGIDVLCANAGISGPNAPVELVSLEDWRACLAVNLDAAFLFAKYTAPVMKSQRSGAILITSSTAGQYGYPNRSPYAASKWAVIGLMKTLAMELGPFGIRANAICPGSVEGPRMEGVLEREAVAKGMTRDEVYQGYASGTSMGRFIEARDIAGMAVFLGSEAARYVSGQVIAVDGHTVNPDP